jgi:hypothetical protein
MVVIQKKHSLVKPFAPSPLQELHRYYGFICHMQGLRYFLSRRVLPFDIFAWHPLYASPVPSTSPDKSHATYTPDTT